MIFSQTKADANELALSAHLKADCRVLHGDIPQRQRELTLKVGGGAWGGEGGMPCMKVEGGAGGRGGEGDMLGRNLKVEGGAWGRRGGYAW